MRIKAGLNSRMPEIGKVKIGEKSTQKNNSGRYNAKRLEYFRVVRPDRDSAKINYLPYEEVMEALGPEPKEVPIILPFDDPELNFQTSYAAYTGNGHICRGDGKTAVMLFLKDGKPAKFTLLDSENLGDTVHRQERREIICDLENCPYRKPDAKNIVRCKPNGRLVFIIPSSKRLNGYFFFRTTGYNTISYITGALEGMKEQTGGILAGIPAKLFFFKKTTESHGNVPVVTIDWDFDQIQKMRQAVISERKYRLDFKKDILQIESQAKLSGLLEDRDAPEEVREEFYPEQTPEFQQKQAAEKTDITARADNALENVEDADFEEVHEETEPDKKEESAGQAETETPEQTEQSGDLDLFED